MKYFEKLANSKGEKVQVDLEERRTSSNSGSTYRKKGKQTSKSFRHKSSDAAYSKSDGSSGLASKVRHRDKDMNVSNTQVDHTDKKGRKTSVESTKDYNTGKQTTTVKKKGRFFTSKKTTTKKMKAAV